MAPRPVFDMMDPNEFEKNYANLIICHGISITYGCLYYAPHLHNCLEPVLKINVQLVREHFRDLDVDIVENYLKNKSKMHVVASDDCITAFQNNDEDNYADVESCLWVEARSAFYALSQSKYLPDPPEPEVWEEEQESKN